MTVVEKGERKGGPWTGKKNVADHNPYKRISQRETTKFVRSHSPGVLDNKRSILVRVLFGGPLRVRRG